MEQKVVGDAHKAVPSFHLNKTDWRWDIVLKLCEEEHLVTIVPAEELYYYDEGVYKTYGEIFVKEKCEAIMEKELSNHDLREMIDHVKRRTYIQEKDIVAQPQLLNCKNGLLDLNTGSLSLHTPDIINFTQIPVDYNPGAHAELFESFLSQIVEQEPDIPLIQEIMGYCLWKQISVPCCAMFLGVGANGKSVLLNVIKSLLGNENVSHRGLQELASDKFATADLFNKMANIYPDIPSEGMTQTGTFKALTSGDKIPAQRKFGHAFAFEPYCKLLFSANRLPGSNDLSDAYFRRWIILRFPKQFIGKDARKNLTQELTTPEMLSGILNWALLGLKRLRENDWVFSHNLAIDGIRTLYESQANPVKAFFDSSLEETDSSSSFLSRNEIYSFFKDYCNKNSLFCFPERMFWERFRTETTNMMKEVTREGIRGWLGIKKTMTAQNEDGADGSIFLPKGEINSHLSKNVLLSAPLSGESGFSIEKIKKELFDSAKITESWLQNVCNKAFGSPASDCAVEDLITLLVDAGLGDRLVAGLYVEELKESGVWFEFKPGRLRLL